MKIQITFDNEKEAKEGVGLLVSIFYFIVYCRIFCGSGFRNFFSNDVINNILRDVYQQANSSVGMWRIFSFGTKVINLPTDLNTWLSTLSEEDFVSGSLFEEYVKPDLERFKGFELSNIMIEHILGAFEKSIKSRRISIVD